MKKNKFYKIYEPIILSVIIALFLFIPAFFLRVLKKILVSI